MIIKSYVQCLFLYLRNIINILDIKKDEHNIGIVKVLNKINIKQFKRKVIFITLVYFLKILHQNSFGVLCKNVLTMYCMYKMNGVQLVLYNYFYFNV